MGGALTGALCRMEGGFHLNLYGFLGTGKTLRLGTRPHGLALFREAEL